MSSSFKIFQLLPASIRPSLRPSTFAPSRVQYHKRFTQHPISRTFSSSSHKMGVHNIQNKIEFDEALKNDIVIVDCFATWCGPCKTISPQVDKFSETYSSAYFVKIDVDKMSEVAQELGIRAMPTFIVFKKGEKVGEVVGANRVALQAAIESAVGA